MPVLPVPDIQLTMLVVLQTLNALPPTKLPLTNRPVAFTHNLTQAPAEMITVLQRPAEPTAEPMMVFWQPVTTSQPALQPKNMLLLAVVLHNPAQVPANKLKQPKVVLRPACSPMKTLSPPVVLSRPAQRPAKKLSTPVVVLLPA